MDEMVDRNIAQLREQAAHYRKLAKSAVPWNIAERFGYWADECDEKAMRLVARHWTRARR